MGNEMGNNNTSEFREEDNRSNETEGKTQEPVHSNDLKLENHVPVPTPENKDYHEKDTELASDDIEPAADTEGKEQEENEVVQKLTEQNGTDSEFQTTVPLTELLEDAENFKNSVSVTSEHQTENESAFEKDKDSVINTTLEVAIALAHNPECEDSGEQVEEISGLPDTSESNIDVHTNEKSREPDNYILDSSENSVIPSTNIDTGKRIDCLANEAESQEDRGLSDEQLLQVGNEDAEDKTEKTNDAEMDSNGTDSSESQAESEDETRLSDEQLLRVGNEDAKAKIEMKNDGEKEDAEDKTEKKNDGETGSDGTDSLELQAESEDKTRLSDEQLLRVGNEDVKAKIEMKNDGEMDSNGANSIESQADVDTDEPLCSDVDVSMPVDKCMILTEETKLIAKASENGDSKNNASESDSEVENFTNFSVEPNCKNDEKGYDMVTGHDASSNGIRQVEGMKVGEESCYKNKASEEHCRESEAKVMMVHWQESLAAKPNINGKGDCETVSSEGRIKLIPELVDVTPKLSITNGTCSIEESQDLESKEDNEPEKEQTFEIEGKTKAAVSAEDGQEKTAEECEGSQVCEESTSVVKLESSSELLAVEASPFHDTNNSSETLTEALVLAEDQQQITVADWEDAHVREEPTSEVKLERSNELLGAVVSPFHATNTSEETMIPEVEFPIEKHEESEADLLHASEITEILTETNYSVSENDPSQQHEESKSSISESRDGIKAQEDVASASNGLIPEISTTTEKTQTPQYMKGVMEPLIEAISSDSGSAEQSNEQSEKVETFITERVVNEEQERVGRFSIESFPDSYNVRSEMRKSPSFGIDLRIEARIEESDQTPLIHQNMNTDEDDLRLQTSLLPVEYNQEILKDQPVPPEEKVITLDRSESEKSRTPFLEQQDSAKNLTNSPSSSKTKPIVSKSKDKHKRRASLFTNCMCCTTVMN
ncbi:hypothetical protein M5689_005881 [Euphorbia peplus]|nr:hypothetical protein M5689_005881 [Euphorbia peplus]